LSHPSRRTRCALAGLLLGVSLACGGAPEPRGRVLLVGIDGASPRVTEPLLAEGRLPHLAQIAEQGVYGRLRSFAPYASPLVWNTVATGKMPNKHGIHWFGKETPEGGSRLFLSTDRKVHALWNIASDAGMRVGVVNWWNTYPVDVIDGVIVSDHARQGEIDRRLKMMKATPRDAGPLVYPPSWQERALALMASEEPLTRFADPFGENEAFPAWVNRKTLSWVYHTDAAAVRAALAVEAEFEPDLLMVFLPGIDRMSHWIWGSIEPQELYPERLRLTEAQREAESTAFYTYYEYTDALLGLLLERFGPDDLVIVVSDHGFENGTALAFLTGIHEGEKAQDGVLFARGARIAHRETRGGLTVQDIAPSILAWLGLPTARDMDGHPAPFLSVSLLEPIESYDTKPIERLAGTPSGVEDEILEQLKNLGYFEK
jgi:predicted AlkP superfamily pyrophosphatase or phosphodiesterase